MSAVQSTAIGRMQELITENERLARENGQLKRENENLARRVDQVANQLTQVEPRLDAVIRRNEQLDEQNRLLVEINAQLSEQTKLHAIALKNLVDSAASKQNWSFAFGSAFAAGVCAVIYYILRK